MALPMDRLTELVTEATSAPAEPVTVEGIPNTGEVIGLAYLAWTRSTRGDFTSFLRELTEVGLTITSIDQAMAGATAQDRR